MLNTYKVISSTGSKGEDINCFEGKKVSLGYVYFLKTYIAGNWRSLVKFYTHGTYFGERNSVEDSVWNAIPIYVKIQDFWNDEISKGKQIPWLGKTTRDTILAI